MDGDVVGSSLLPCSGGKQTAKFIRARRLQSGSTQLRPKTAAWELNATKELSHEARTRWDAQGRR